MTRWYRSGIANILLLLVALAFGDEAARAEVWITGRHQMSFGVSHVQGDWNADEDAPQAGTLFDQEAHLLATGRFEGGWHLDAVYDSRLADGNRVHLDLRNRTTRIVAGKVGLSGGVGPFEWSTELAGVRGEIQEIHETGEIQAATGTTLGLPISFRLRGDGSKGPYELGEGPAVESSLKLMLDGEPLTAGRDFSFDSEFAEVTFFRPVPVTSTIEGVYRVASEVSRLASGAQAEWRLGAFNLTVAGARERRIGETPHGSLAEAAYPDQVAMGGLAVSYAAPQGQAGDHVEFVVASVGSRSSHESGNAWSEPNLTTRQASGWHLSGAYAPAEAGWRASAAITRREPGFRLIGQPEESGGTELIGEWRTVNDSRSTQTRIAHVRSDPTEDGEPEAVELWTIGHRMETSGLSVDLEAGVREPAGSSVKSWAATLDFAPWNWDVSLQWRGASAPVWVDVGGESLDRKEVVASGPLTGGKAKVKWVDERAAVHRHSDEVRHTGALEWKGQAGGGDVGVNAMFSSQLTEAERRNLVYTQVHRRLAKTEESPRQIEWSAEWSRLLGSGFLRHSGAVSFSVQAESGAVEWNVAGGVGAPDLAGSRTTWVVQTGRSLSGIALEGALFGQYPEAPRGVMRIGATTSTGPWTFSGRATHGSLEEPPLVHRLAETSAIAPVDLGHSLEGRVEWGTGAWKWQGEVKSVWRRHADGPKRPNRHATIDLKAEYSLGDRSELQLAYGIGSAEWEWSSQVTSKWGASVVWEWTARSRVEAGYDRKWVVEGAERVAGLDRLSLHVETLF